MKESLLPKVSIVIVTYNARTSLGNILDKAILSALNQTYSNIEVIVVDNGSLDETADYVGKMFGNKVKIVKLSKNYGYCLAVNLALRYIDKSSKYVLFQNSDAILAEDYVEKLLVVAEQDPRIAALQGLELNPGNKTHGKIGGCLDLLGYFRELRIRREEETNIYVARSCIEVPFIFGAAMLVRRDIFEIIGGFPADFFMYYDEPDLAFRLRSLGYKLKSCINTYYLHYVGFTVSRLHELSLVPLYFNRRNRLRIIIRYYYGKYLILALIHNFTVIIGSILTKSSFVRRALIRILLDIPRYLRRDVIVRKRYISGLRRDNVLKGLICRDSPIWRLML